MTDLLQAVTLGAATGEMPALPPAPFGVDVIAETWNATGDPVELADLAEVTGLVAPDGPWELIHELLFAYSAHFGDYERSLIQQAVQTHQAGSAQSREGKELSIRLSDAVQLHSNSPTWMPLLVAGNLLGPSYITSATSSLRTLAGFEGSPAYPFQARYIADLIHARLPPVTTEAVYGAAIAAQRAGIGSRAPQARARGRAQPAQEMRQNPTRRRPAAQHRGRHAGHSVETLWNDAAARASFCRAVAADYKRGGGRRTIAEAAHAADSIVRDAPMRDTITTAQVASHLLNEEAP